MIEWEDLALETAERFGGTLPHPETATAIAAVYAKAPNAVQRAIDRVANDYTDGNIRSPWGVLKARVQQITTDTQQAQRGNDLEKRVARAEQWIRNAGTHYDRWTEIHDELFGDRGQLREHHTQQLENRLRGIWQDHRPDAEHVEIQQEAMMARWSQQWLERHRTLPNAQKPLDEGIGTTQTAERLTTP